MEAREAPRPARTKSWGQEYRLSMMDRFGIWLSVVAIRRMLGPLRGKSIADFGAGFQAAFVRSILDEVAHATVVDLSLSEELDTFEKLTVVRGQIPAVLATLPDESFDAIVCNNVIEHLWDPKQAVHEIRRTLKTGGACFINVPSWSGKTVLETAAFRLGMTSADEIDDHKAYYSRRELWSLLVRSGFKPSQVRCRTHKFGLNTYAVCRKD